MKKILLAVMMAAILTPEYADAGLGTRIKEKFRTKSARERSNSSLQVTLGTNYQAVAGAINSLFAGWNNTYSKLAKNGEYVRDINLSNAIKTIADCSGKISDYTSSILANSTSSTILKNHTVAMNAVNMLGNAFGIAMNSTFGQRHGMSLIKNLQIMSQEVSEFMNTNSQGFAQNVTQGSQNVSGSFNMFLGALNEFCMNVLNNFGGMINNGMNMPNQMNSMMMNDGMGMQNQMNNGMGMQNQMNNMGMNNGMGMQNQMNNMGNNRGSVLTNIRNARRNNQNMMMQNQDW